MPGRYDAVIGDTVTLEAQFYRDGEPFDLFEIEMVELTWTVGAGVVQTKPGSAVVRLGIGHYEVTFDELTAAGDFEDVWTYTPVEGASSVFTKFSVIVAGVTGESPETPPVDPEGGVPAIGLDKVYMVTHTFYTAGGVPFRGVYVRFSPEISPEHVIDDASFIAQIAEAVSDENGHLSMYLVRGTQGLLAITGVGLVRRVTVPDVGTIDLFDLVAPTDDLFEVQRPEFVTLPRRS